MKSAYVTLGIPGNAGAEDIEEAYRRALGHFSKEKLAADPSLFARVDEVKEAYKVLSNRDLRQAHDRKITAGAAPRVVRVIEPAKDTTGNILKFVALGILVAILVGWYVSHQREEAKKAKEAQELALKQEEAAQAAQAEKDAAAAAAKRAADNAQAARTEQQLRNESSQIAQRAQAMDTYQQTMAANRDRMEKTTANINAAVEKQQAANAAAQRAAADQRALRNLCIINTGRPNC